MQDVFSFRNDLINSYSSFSKSFANISATDIRDEVERAYSNQRYWPEPLIQINPSYQRAASVAELVSEGTLHPGCAKLFRVGRSLETLQPLQLFKHQMEAVTKARYRRSFVVTTGTGSGKSLSFFLPIVDHILREKDKDPAPRTRAIIIYPMNALANSQVDEMGKFLKNSGSDPLLTIARYTGQESDSERQQIANNPPDILLTNFMMLELILTRFDPEVDLKVVQNCLGLEFLVLDELHTYRGRQGADVAMLVRRLRQRFQVKNLVCIGTSATMSSKGTSDDRRQTVSFVASQLFGTPVTQDDVIEETLERATDLGLDLNSVRPMLRARLGHPFAWQDTEAFRKDPLVVWTELTLGLKMSGQSRPERAKPMSISEAAKLLALDAQVDPSTARQALEDFLIAAQEMKTPDGRALFAFKLHQWISGPGKVHCTLEPHNRVVTLEAQRFAPGRSGEGVLLFATHFCRECGAEYHPVWQGKNGGFSPREIDETGGPEAENGAGFLVPKSALISEEAFGGVKEDLPESWLEERKGKIEVKQTYKPCVPVPVQVEPDGSCGVGGGEYWFIPGKFRFCLNCGHEHTAHGRDINRLASLSGEGRSSATTILSLAILRQHFQSDVKEGASDFRKLLGFTDNRQDAALQAGHFNDFHFLVLLRSASVAALKAAGGCLGLHELMEATLRVLKFDRKSIEYLREFMEQPTAFGVEWQTAQRAIRFALGYRLLADVRKGWRFNNPNLLQLDLITLDYLDLTEIAASGEFFNPARPPGSGAYDETAWGIVTGLTPETRATLLRLIFDSMVRDLCIQSGYFSIIDQEHHKNSGNIKLAERWRLETDQLRTTKYLIVDPRPEVRGKAKRMDLVGGGARSRLVRAIRYHQELPSGIKELNPTQISEVIRCLLLVCSSDRVGCLRQEEVAPHVYGWSLSDSILQWRLNPTPTEKGSRANVFFRDLYDSTASLLLQERHSLYEFEAQEHTAQVDADTRKILEARFRGSRQDQQWWSDRFPGRHLSRLPILYCSPTMELGVDISALNTVYMRNVPPAPANYAQRSGRAGRSGQAALVLTYAAAQSPHDQWFFHHVDQMVQGVVKPPTLDLANRELVESHIHAIWLASLHYSIPTAIRPMLDLEHEDLPLVPEVREAVASSAAAERARSAATSFFEQIRPSVETCPWFHHNFIQQVIQDSPAAFNIALDRWRQLYKATREQLSRASAIADSPAYAQLERDNANRRRNDAHAQLNLLLRERGGQNNDFYTFRYLASQGFLPGYNFPRLPLMAWLPAVGKTGAAEDEGNMVSRPRFLALSEFGPRSLIYHRGRMFRVYKAKLNATGTSNVSTELPTLQARVCDACGYGHWGTEAQPEPTADLCHGCQQPLTPESHVRSLYRIETVETRAVERISVNDEDRQRQGFEIVTAYHYLAGAGGRIDLTKKVIHTIAGDVLARLTYSPSARLWRINRGWRRRKDKARLGFNINPMTGYWSKAEVEERDGADEDPEEKSKVAPQCIVPYVEDTKNILLLTPEQPLSLSTMATLQAALNRAIEQSFQVEASEILTEPLPLASLRKSLLIYEASEGGAGVLIRLLEDETMLSQVAREALKIMHFELPDRAAFTLADLVDLAGSSKEHECEAGCYRCLLSYYNQPDHKEINRRDPQAIEFLVGLANGRSATDSKPAENTAGSTFTAWMSQNGHRPPDRENLPILDASVVVPAVYDSERLLVFLSPVADAVMDYAVDSGWHVLVLPSDREQWAAFLAAYPSLL
ncbi:MAG: DEAD/DEAH box helicase [Verrucomicrobiaceae bacterium]|nr:DEAD/DEAH box helicase [Verrucomicrobiaceae bacterium]